MRTASRALWVSALLWACGSDDGAQQELDASPSPVTTGEASVSPALGADASPAELDAARPQPSPEASTQDARMSSQDAGPASNVSDAAAGTDAMTNAAEGGANAGGACTRESLKAAVEAYYAALSARNPGMLKLSSTLKFTENAKQLMLGEGLWKSAGMVRFKRSALDVMQCETVTESVVDNGGTDYILGLRLKLSGDAISEVESILVGPDGWFPNPKNIISSASEDWETPLPEAMRSTRELIQKDIVDGYFLGLFGGKIKVADYPFASTCKRAENGFSPGACNFGVPTSMPMTPKHYVVDLEAGIGVGFVLFGSASRGMLDFHMFKVKSGQVYGVRAVVGPSVSGRNW